MQKPLSILSLKTGLILFILATWVTLTHGGSSILIFTHFLPGLFYGFVLSRNIGSATAFWKKVVFVILSTTIYFFCAYKVNFFNDQEYLAVRFMLYSVLGAVLLKICYDFLFKTLSILYTLVLTLVAGIVASLASSLCAYCISTNNIHNEFISTLLLIGVYTIFPIWQYLFGLILDYQNKAAANKCIAKSVADISQHQRL